MQTAVGVGMAAPHTDATPVYSNFLLQYHAYLSHPDQRVENKSHFFFFLKISYFDCLTVTLTCTSECFQNCSVSCKSSDLYK